MYKYDYETVSLETIDRVWRGNLTFEPGGSNFQKFQKKEVVEN